MHAMKPDDAPYQVEMSTDFHPWRRDMEFLPVHEAPIRPLLDELDFVEDRSRWGYKFRFGVFEIGADDFERIRRALMP